MNIIKFINQLNNNGIFGENQITISVIENSNSISFTLLKPFQDSFIELFVNSFDGIKFYKERDGVYVFINKLTNKWDIIELYEESHNKIIIDTIEINTASKLFYYLFRNFKILNYNYQEWNKYIQLPDFEDIYLSLEEVLKIEKWEVKEQYIDYCNGNFEKNITVFEKNSKKIHVYPPQKISGYEYREIYNHSRDNQESPYNWEDMVNLYFNAYSLSDLF